MPAVSQMEEATAASYIWQPQDLSSSPVLNALLGARRSSMSDLLDRLESEFGSIAKYLDWIGFDVSWRLKLRLNFVVESDDPKATPKPPQATPEPFDEHDGGMGSPSCAANEGKCVSAGVGLNAVCRL